MKGDDPYQPSETIQGPDRNRALPSGYWTGRKIFVLFLIPSVISVSLRLVNILALPYHFDITHFAPIQAAIALGVNCKLTSLFSNYTLGSGLDGMISLITWFVVWVMAQIVLYSISLTLLRISLQWIAP